MAFQNLFDLKQSLEKMGYVVEVPPPEITADLAIPSFKTNPQVIVSEIKKINDPLIKNISVQGRYINIDLDKQKLAAVILPQIFQESDCYGNANAGRGKKIIIEYSQPNVAKPLNVGHFRSTMIGQALVNLYRWQGFEIIAINHLGDWGTQFGKLLIAYQKWGDAEKDLFKLYVKFHDEAEKHPELEQEARDAFNKLEQGDQASYQIWKKITDDSIAHFQKIYDELGVKFDHVTGESFYKDLVGAAIEEALDKKVAIHSEGAVVVPEEKTGLPTFVIQKKDESSIYGSRDLATAKYRLKTWNPEKIIYVVGSEQALYFRQIFKTMELLGYDVKKFVHVSLGLVILPEGKMSTRKGRVVLLDDLLREALEKTKNDKIIGYGALIYNALASSPERTVVFDWQKMLSTEGASAPYIQYGYVRAKSILMKAGQLTASQAVSPINMNENQEQLIKLLALFPERCQQAQQLNSPHLLATYLNTLVQEFNRFYVHSPVLTAKATEKQFRLQLVMAFMQVVKNGLALLNIGVPEKM